MRFRTKLFITSGLVVVLLLAGTMWPIQRLLWSNLDRLAGANFTATRQGMRSLQAEHVRRLRQVGKMVMEIPELRALIAEDNFEVSAENLNSLQDRLNSLTDIMGVSFVCVLDNRQTVIAQNSSSPWPTLNDLRAFLRQSAQARPLVNGLFKTPLEASVADQGEYGIWLYRGQLYQVVGLPLVFTADERVIKADGALIMAAPITNALAKDLALSHNCEISFLATDGGTASSLSPASSGELRRTYDQHLWQTSSTFDTDLDGTSYRSYVEPLLDPCSQTVVGATVLQSSMGDGIVLQRKISLSLLAIMSGGLLAAACVSYILSGAVTRPVHELVDGVRRVAGGDLNSTIANHRHDEIGELAIAFNDMVAQLRARRELERLVEESQAASKAKSQFLANMSHEIRTPLHGVIGMANLLLDTDLNHRQRHYAQLVRSSTEVLTKLINDILDFSKIEAGKLELETVEFELHPVVEDVVELLYQQSATKNVELACDIGSDVPMTVRGDATRLRQILLNLIGNAAKFTQAGEIIVRLSRENAVSGAALVRFEISDTGVGIPPDRLGRLFKSFSQVDASTTRKYGGTGLGLAICKQLAELMGGQIGVESQTGRGSTFWFTANLQSIEGGTSAAPALAGVRVLVADGNATVRGILSRQLAAAGMDAQGAGNSEEAQQMLTDAQAAGGAFGVVLASRSVDGIARLLEAVRNRRIPSILLATAGDQKPDALEAMGFAAVVAKPVRRSHLLDALAQALGREAPGPQKSHSANKPSPSALLNKSIRILVAEDNEINQIVAAEFLSKAGFEAHVVNDGMSAVKAVMEGRYDLVLMDCQMPVMDGFEATREIRQHEEAAKAAGHTVRQVPIIALTANASGADRERCMEAGMNGYCGKPFREKELLETLAAFLPKSQAPELSPVIEAPVPQVAPVETISVEASPFSVEALLGRCTGNTALALKILDKFEKQTSDAVTQIEGHLRDRNSEQVARISHSMKGTAGVFAAESLRVVLAEMEQHGRNNTLDLGEACILQLRQEVVRCLSYASEARTQLKAKSSTKV